MGQIAFRIAIVTRVGDVGTTDPRIKRLVSPGDARFAHSLLGRGG